MMIIEDIVCNNSSIPGTVLSENPWESFHTPNVITSYVFEKFQNFTNFSEIIKYKQEKSVTFLTKYISV